MFDIMRFVFKGLNTPENRVLMNTVMRQIKPYLPKRPYAGL
jgi:hypothetical protein